MKNYEKVIRILVLFHVLTSLALLFPFEGIPGIALQGIDDVTNVSNPISMSFYDQWHCFFRTHHTKIDNLQYITGSILILYVKHMASTARREAERV